MNHNGIEHFKENYNLSDQAVLIFPYGSRVYGTANEEKSDYDYLAVIFGKSIAKTGEEYKHGNTNVHIFEQRDWQHQLDDHKIHTLEAYFLPDGICRSRFRLKLKTNTLRHTLSEKASHSFVKAKKKIDKEKDFYIGWKSLFHSLRILNFGIQIAVTGSINDYSAANHYWFDLLHNPQYEWYALEEKYKPIYNELATKFRRAAPK